MNLLLIVLFITLAKVQVSVAVEDNEESDVIEKTGLEESAEVGAADDAVAIPLERNADDYSTSGVDKVAEYENLNIKRAAEDEIDDKTAASERSVAFVEDTSKENAERLADVLTDSVVSRAAIEESASDDVMKSEILEPIGLTRRSFTAGSSVDESEKSEDAPDIDADLPEKNADVSDQNVDASIKEELRTDPDKSEQNNGDSKVDSGIATELSLNREADSDIKAVSTSANVERFGFSESDENNPSSNSRIMLGFPPRRLQANVPRFDVFSQFGSQRTYPSDLMPSLQPPNLQQYSGALLPEGGLPAMYNLPSLKNTILNRMSPESYNSRRSFVPQAADNRDMSSVQSYSPYANSYPYSPMREGFPRNQPETEVQRYHDPEISLRSQRRNNLHSIFESNFSPVKQPLFVDRHRRNVASSARVSPFVGYFKGLFEDFKMKL